MAFWLSLQDPECSVEDMVGDKRYSLLRSSN